MAKKAEKKPVVATPEEVIARIQEWAARRASGTVEYLPTNDSYQRAIDREQVYLTLYSNTALILGALATRLKDIYATRVWLDDLLPPEVKAALRREMSTPWFLDVVRIWAESVLKAQVRAEGDPAHSGVYLTWA